MDAAVRWEASPRIAQESAFGAGFQEAALWHSSPKLGLFYRPCTEQTAFVVDLLGTAHWVEVATALPLRRSPASRGNEDSLAKAGVSAAAIHLREKLLLASWEDEATPPGKLSLRCTGPILPWKKEGAFSRWSKKKRKAFLRQISRGAQTAGVPKKGHVWTADLAPGTVLQWHAQKSGFSDEYYF